MDERLRFIARLLEGEKMAVLCREFDISRQTGHKFYKRYKDLGLEGLTDRSRRPYRQANRLPERVESLIVQLRREHPSWGAPKIREKVKRLGLRHQSSSHQHRARGAGSAWLGQPWTAPSSLQGRRYRLSRPDRPNDLWCADYKGEFMLADHRYCYPLTITDFSSRYLLCCEGLHSTREQFAFSIFERTFKEYGLPCVIRSDNGVPFASKSTFFGLSKLSVWWLRLGIAIERIKPAHPEQNGRHERMHLTLKKEATKPAGKNFLQQQARFDDFTRVYNHERPHQALNMRYPAELYRPSARAYTGLPALEYPFHDLTLIVTQCGRLCFGRRKINLSQVFAGQAVGVREVADHIWLISFMHYDLGFFDDQCNRVECAPNPFSAKVSAMSSV